MSDSDEDKSNSGGDKSGSDEENSQNGSGSDNGSGSGSGSKSNSGSDSGSKSGSENSKSGSKSSGSDNSGSKSGSDGNNSGSESSKSEKEEKKEKKEKKEEKKQDEEFVYKPSPYQQLMNTLREINLEMDIMTKSVDQIERKCSKGGKTSAFKEEEQQKLLKEIDEQLEHKKSQASVSPEKPAEKESARKEPRNYHPPESPVRRVYENGYELDERTAQDNYPNYVNPGRPNSTFDNNRPPTSFGTPGYSQTLYNAAPRQASQEGRGFEYSQNHNTAPRSYAGGPPPASALGYQPSNVGNPRSQSPLSISRFANKQQQQKPPAPLPPRTYTDFYRNQTYINNSQNITRAGSPQQQHYQTFTGPAHFGQLPNQMQNSAQTTANIYGTMPVQREFRSLSYRSSPTNINRAQMEKGIQNAIDTLLK